MEENIFNGDATRKDIVFDSNVQIKSLQDVFKLTTRVFLLEDFIASKFGENLGSSGYTKRKDLTSSDLNETVHSKTVESTKNTNNKKHRKSRRASNASKHKCGNSSSGSNEESDLNTSEKGETSAIYYDFAHSHDDEDYNEDDIDIKNVLVEGVNAEKCPEAVLPSSGPIQNSQSSSNVSNHGTRKSKLRKCKELVKYTEPADDENAPNKRLKADETSESENEDTTTPETPKRKYRENLWVESNQLDTIEEARAEIKSQKTWRLRRRYTSLKHDFEKIVYDCKYSRDCAAKMKIEMRSIFKKVRLYKTTDNHTHVKKVRVTGIPVDVKNEIEKLIENGVTTPKAMLRAFPTDVPTPSRAQLANYLSYRRVQSKRENPTQLPNDIDEEIAKLVNTTGNVSSPSEK